MDQIQRRRSFMSFLLGVVLGAYPVRWGLSVGLFLAGFVIGNFYSFLKFTLGAIACRP
jgi:hypothetical protein